MSLAMRAYDAIFPRFSPRPEWRKSGSIDGAAVQIGWFGTAAHSIEGRRTTLLIDPFVSRQGPWELATQPLAPNREAIERHLPARVDAILCGHSHYDHIADAPLIAKLTGAKLIGSHSTCAWGQAMGLPSEQLIAIGPQGGTVSIGDATVRFLPSRHGKALFGRVPLPGTVEHAPGPFGRVFHYRMGGAYGLWIELDGVRIYHNGSADLVDAELDGVGADVLLACLAGRKGTDRYLPRLVEHLAPKLIVPTHHDAFFAPLEHGVRLLPNIDVPGFLAEAASSAPKAQQLAMLYDERIAVAPGAADACVVAPRA